MSLYETIAVKHGSRIRQTGLVIRRNSIKTAERFRHFTSRYLIDETKAGYRTPEAAAKSGGDYLSKVALGLAPMRPGVDYQAGESNVWSFGLANHPIYKSHPNPLKLTDNQRLDLVVEWWLKERSHATVLAHHMVFSLDPKLTAALAERPATKHVPLDTLLLKCVTNTFLEFASHFYPRDQIGFVTGIHHDKPHAHAHVLVHPMTANGQRVNLSTNGLEKGTDKAKEEKKVIQYQAHLKASFTRQTRALAEYCFGEENDFTWIGRDTNKQDLAVAREEMVLAILAQKEPEATPSEGAGTGIAGCLRARRKLLAQPNYPQLIRRSRAVQRQQVTDSAKLPGEPEHVVTNFEAIHQDLEGASRRVSETAGMVATMFGEQELQPDRPGPVMRTDCRVPLSRSCAFPYLREHGEAPLPTPFTVPAFLRRRTGRHEQRLRVMGEEVAAYAQAGRDYTRVESEQHVCLADAAAMLLAYSGELTNHVPAFLQEPVPGLPRVPDETLVPALVTRDLCRLSQAESFRFRPFDTENPPAPPVEDTEPVEPSSEPAPPASSNPVSSPSAETATRLIPIHYPGTLSLISNGMPEEPETWSAKLHSVVTPDI